MEQNSSPEPQKDSTTKMLNACLALVCIGGAFIAWGYLSTLKTKTFPASLPTKAAKTKQAATDRKAILNDVKKGTKADINDTNEKSVNVLFNDPFIQSSLKRTDSHRAWEITQGSKDIVIAVIDTGIDEKHKDLADNLWINPGESGLVDNEFCKQQVSPLATKRCNKALNGIDDDGNGLIDDVHGWNFVSNDSSLVDNHGHGTHIAGIIAGKHGNSPGVGITGVAPNVSVMILKYYDPKSSNSNNLRNTIQAIRYAIAKKVNIINYSGGGTDYSAEEFAAVKEAERAGILFIAAAGNERSNSDEAGKHYYPADYGLTNIISVTAVNETENKEDTKVLPSSNYGVRTVDLAAPGENIKSTLPGNSYGVMTGTSQATAFVTGVAALILSVNRDFSVSDVKKYVLRTGDEYPTLLSKTGTSKLLNSYKALTSLDKGVSASGVVATNTAKVGARAFAADQNIRNQKFDTSALSNGSGDPNEGDAESIALFSRDFVKAIDTTKVKK